MHARVLLFSLFAFAGAAQAQDAVLITTPEVSRDAELRREIERATDSREYRAAYETAYANLASDGARDAKRRQCADAKAHREATLKVVGLSRSFELLRELDDSVYEACKGL